jgi:4-amino-4-deoxychorismate lyase
VSSPPEITLVNGAAADTLSTTDRGLQYGDGLFETIACSGGRARFLSLHLDRLARSCERLQITADLATIQTEIETLASGADRSIVKMIVTRGPWQARGYSFTGSEVATRIAFRFPWPAEGDTSAGVRVRTAQMRLGENAALAGIKHLSRLEQVLARAELRGGSESELLMFSSSGRLVSGTMSNVFIVRGDRLVTPRLDLCGVAGVMRRVVMREAGSAGIGVEERVVEAREIFEASEVFLTNVRLGAQPVAVLDGRKLNVGPLTRRVQELIAKAADG